MRIVSIFRYAKYLFMYYVISAYKYFFVISEDKKKRRWIEDYLCRNPECVYRNAAWAYRRYLDSLSKNNTSNTGKISRCETNMFNIDESLKALSVDEIKQKRYERLDGKPKIDCLIFGSKNETNIGTMLRTSELLGGNKVWFANCKRIVPMSAVGANYYMDYECIDLSERELFENFVNQNKYYCIFIEKDDTSQELQNINLKQLYLIKKTTGKRLLFVFGNESYGIPSHVLESKIDKCVVSIPQLGIMKSLNVSSCHSIVMWEIQKNLMLN